VVIGQGLPLGEVALQVALQVAQASLDLFQLLDVSLVGVRLTAQAFQRGALFVQLAPALE
jgi:hypothetical protein